MTAEPAEAAIGRAARRRHGLLPGAPPMLRRIWRGYCAWRELRRAIELLNGRHDGGLRDIGLAQSEIERAARGLHHEQG
jgi:uncharacterized protein YjiS (DUF1127 family)